MKRPLFGLAVALLLVLCSRDVSGALVAPAPGNTGPSPGGTSYRVTMSVFSGRPDPECEIDDTDPAFDDIFSALEGFTDTDLDDCLGYRGLTIASRNSTGHVVYHRIGKKSNVDLEDLLITHCFRQLDPRVTRYVRTTLRPGEPGEPGEPAEPSAGEGNVHIKTFARTNNSPATMTRRARVLLRMPHPRFNNRPGLLMQMLPPKFRTAGRKRRQATEVCQPTPHDPENWNYLPVQRLNNCYNYASAIRTDTFAQPGRGAGRKFDSLVAASVLDGVTRDGFTPLRITEARAAIERGECVMALVLWQGVDYHFYRVDANRLWSHKRGRTAAKNVDESNNLISDPLTADRGPYTEFVSFLGVYGPVTVL